MSALIVLALGLSTAQAQVRQVPAAEPLTLSQLESDEAAARSEQYRAAAREKRHEAIRMLEDLIVKLDEGEPSIEPTEPTEPTEAD